MKYHIHIGEQEIPLELYRDGETIRVNNGNREIPLDIHYIGDGFISVIIGGRQYDLYLSENSGNMVVHIGFNKFEVSVLDEREKMLSEFAKSHSSKTKLSELKAPMPGLVVKILVKAGDEFKRGEGLIIIEAMKMENELKAVDDGRVKEIKVSSGDAVDKGTMLMKFE